jgi:outer membrane autotransporter protein
MAGAPDALAQSVTLGGNTNPALEGDIDASVDLEIGTGGASGSMLIEDGGQVTNATGFIGNGPGGTGEVTVTGQGSTWTNMGDLIAGQSAAGELHIEDGGTVNSLDGYIGAEPGILGDVTVSGSDINGNASTWNASGMFVGYEGVGTLTVEDGGHVAVSGRLDVGLIDTGDLRIENGGTVSAFLSIIGENDGAEGHAVVTGEGTRWDTTTQLIVGNFGLGTLRIEDGATVTSNQGYIGAGPTGDGTVTVTGDGSNWHVTASSVTIGNFGVGSLTIEQSALVRVEGDIRFGMSDPGSSGTLNLTGTAGDRGVLETTGLRGGQGTADVTIDGGILRAIADNSNFVSGFGTQQITFGAGGAIIDTDGHDIGIATGFTGTGGLTKDGEGTLTLTGLSDYSGPTDVLAGTLTVDGSIADSTVLVYDDATLSGSGSVGATTIATGGAIAPGTGVGTISVVGDYVQQADAIYQVAVDPTSTASDLIAVTGEATLDAGAIINVTKTTNAPYILGTRYTVLTTTAGLDGEFELTGETGVTALLRLTGDYDANNAYLLVQQSGTVDSVGETPNQIATGEGVDALDPSDPVKTAVINLPDEDAVRDALDQLSGEIHASVKTATIENSHFVRDVATDRLREAFCGVATRAAIHKQAADEEGRLPKECTASDRPVAWGQVFGSWGSTDSDGNAAKMERATGGFFTGADAQIFGTWRVGVLAGYSHSRIDVDDRNSSATSDDYHLGVYGGTQWGRLGLRTGGAYTWQDIGTDRSVDFQGFNDRLTADYQAGVTQVFGDLGYRVDAGRFALEPFANLAYVGLDTDGFTESGDAAALTSSGNTTDTFFTTIGLRGSTSIELGGMHALARGSVGWRHASGDTTPVSMHAFNGGPFFEIAGVPIAGDAALVNAGVDFNIADRAVLAVSYAGQFSVDAIDQSARARLSFQF